MLFCTYWLLRARNGVDHVVARVGPNVGRLEACGSWSIDILQHLMHLASIRGFPVCLV
jgi:hypothetical protein